MKDFQFIFDVAPKQPSSRSSVIDVFGWAVWRAMELGLKDVVVDESEHGLLVGCLDYARRGKNRGPKYIALATFPHLRGSPLKKFPSKALGVAACERGKWNIRVWTCQKLAGETFRLCAIVQLVPQAAA